MNERFIIINLRKMKKLDSLEASYRCCAWGLWICVLMMIALWLTSCTTTRVMTVEKVKTDTTYITKQQRDSIWLHDSIHVTERGDTIRIEKWHTKYIEREVHDTLYRAKTDSIPVPYEVIKEVPRQSKWFERIMFCTGIISILCLILFVAKKIERFLP
jgi:hypothetical protein